MTLVKRKAPCSFKGPERKKHRAAQINDKDDGDDDSASEYSDVSSSDEQLIEHSISATGTPLTPFSPFRDSDRRPNCYHCPYEDCDKSFNRPCRLKDHIRSHTNDRPFRCDVSGCDKTFMRETHLRRHVTSAHTNDRKYVCEWDGCGKKFATGTRLRRHVAAHEGKEQFRCTGFPPCSEIFRKHSTLQSHVSSAHLNKKPYPCTHIEETTGKQCSQAYDTAGRLKAHRIRVHGGERYFCTLCTIDMSSLREEDRSLSGDQGEMAGFPSHDALRDHIREAHPPMCPECSAVFTKQNELRRHIQQTHTGAVPLEERRKFVCPDPECKRGFTSKHNLTVHVRSVHLAEKPFTCGEVDLSKSKYPEVAEWDGIGKCGSQFTSKHSLESHVRNQHAAGNNSKRAQKQKREQKEKKKRVPAATRITGIIPNEEGDLLDCCLRPDCDYQPTHEDDLFCHLSNVHGMAEVEIEDALAERTALSGGKFWLGGIDPHDLRLQREDEEANYALDREFGIKGTFERINVNGGYRDPLTVGQVDPGLLDPLLDDREDALMELTLGSTDHHSQWIRSNSDQQQNSVEDEQMLSVVWQYLREDQVE